VLKNVMVRPLVVAAFVLTACGTATSSDPAPQITAALTAQETAEATPALADKFPVGDGRELYLRCAGEGSPTIILEAGGQDDSDTWGPADGRPFFDQLQQLSRTCAYDRANMARSDPAPGPRYAQDSADDLAALLAAAEVPGPYLLVGSSWGGILIAAYAADHPDDVAGMVLLDAGYPSTDPGMDATRDNLPPEEWAAIVAAEQWDNPQNSEHMDIRASIDPIAAKMDRIPDVPITAITATLPSDCPPDWPCEEILRDEAVLQAQWAELSPYGRQVFVETGHVTYVEDPEAIVEIIADTLEDVRTR
jgi:pimeloyl-ACP methyl ester carboxylesterase